MILSLAVLPFYCVLEAFPHEKVVAQKVGHFDQRLSECVQKAPGSPPVSVRL
ncbi:MAG TPA: hypothetical protein VLH56_08965 [Dissulfurispiraceae bacterium]|nr:hypothetical protein [Dissulfurispiraceae bacterium]